MRDDVVLRVVLSEAVKLVPMVANPKQYRMSPQHVARTQRRVGELKRELLHMLVEELTPTEVTEGKWQEFTLDELAVEFELTPEEAQRAKDIPVQLADVAVLSMTMLLRSIRPLKKFAVTTFVFHDETPVWGVIV